MTVTSVVSGSRLGCISSPWRVVAGVAPGAVVRKPEQMILEFAKRTVQPGVTALEMRGSIHCGPEKYRAASGVTS